MRGLIDDALASAPPPPLDHSLIRELLLENEAMLMEIMHLRSLRHCVEVERSLRAVADESAARHSLRAAEAEGRVALFTEWQSLLLAALSEAAEEAETLRDAIECAQAKFTCPDAQAAEEQTTPARITAAGVAVPLLANYAQGVRWAIGARKRARDSDGWESLRSQTRSSTGVPE